MKKKFSRVGIINIKINLCSLLMIFSSILLSSTFISAQEEDLKQDKPVRAVFESSILIDNQTVDVPVKGTFQYDIIHRFGTLKNGFDDFFGLYSNSNIKLGFNYVPIDNLSLGVGLTKFKHLLDLNAKYAILKQTRADRMPISVSYFGNMVFDMRDEENREVVYNSSDRISYFHQIIVGRKFNNWLSLQLAPSVSHYNIINENMNNDHYAIAMGAQFNLSGGRGIIINVDQPLTGHELNNPIPI